MNHTVIEGMAAGKAFPQMRAMNTDDARPDLRTRRVGFSAFGLDGAAIRKRRSKHCEEFWKV